MLAPSILGLAIAAMKILLIDDEVTLSGIVRKGLENDGYAVDWAADGDEGLQLARSSAYDLIILDLMLPRRDGWDVCETLRSMRDATPILMLTARDTVTDRVRGLDAGADDYLPKPFDFAELRARVRALLRRDHVHKSRVIRIRDLEIDRDHKSVTRGGVPVDLTPREYSLLEALAVREGQVLSREFIQDRIWGDADSYSNTVEVYIAMLRKKIDAGRDTRLIHTVHRRGYVLQDGRR